MGSEILQNAFQLQQLFFKKSPAPRYCITWNNSEGRFYSESYTIVSFLVRYQTALFLPIILLYIYLFVHGLWQPSTKQFAYWAMTTFMFLGLVVVLIMNFLVIRGREEITYGMNEFLRIENILRLLVLDSDSEGTQKQVKKFKSKRKKISLLWRKDTDVFGVILWIAVIYLCILPYLMIFSFSLLFLLSGELVDPCTLTLRSLSLNDVSTSWIYYCIIFSAYFLMITEWCLIMCFVSSTMILTVGKITLALQLIEKVSHFTPAGFTKALQIYRQLTMVILRYRVVLDSFILVSLTASFIMFMVPVSIALLGFEHLPLSIYWFSIACLCFVLSVNMVIMPRVAAWYSFTMEMINTWKYRRGNTLQMRKEVEALQALYFHFGSYRKLNAEANRVYFDSLSNRTADFCLLVREWKT